MLTVAVGGATNTVLQWFSDESQLTESEHRRASAFAHQEDRLDYIAAHLLLRGVATFAGVSQPEYTQSCMSCGSSSHGRPWIEREHNAWASLSHTRGAVMAGVSEHPIGVDIEEIRPIRGQGIHAVFNRDESRWLVDSDDATLRCWCRKEAAAKAKGRGISEMVKIATVDNNGNWLPGNESLVWDEGSFDSHKWCVASSGRCDVRTVEDLWVSLRDRNLLACL